MKARFVTAMAVCAVLASFGLVRAEDTAVTVKGRMECAKCMQHEGDKCQNVLVVKEGDKMVNYYMTDDDATKGLHADVCKEAKDGVTCTGTVTERDGKKWITCTKVEGLKKE